MSQRLTTCPTCSAELPHAGAACPVCVPTRVYKSSEAAPPEAAAPGARPYTPPAFDSSQDSARFRAGDTFAERYRIVSLLGRGGMGEVYRADDLILDLSVALKFLPQNLEHDAEALQRLKDEVRTAREISHPHVCRVFDIGHADGAYFISMEHVDGDSLSAYLKRLGRISREKAHLISTQICQALHAVHQKGILHRDLKPANILLDEAGNISLTDFGLAATIGESSLGGTPAYMAPEIWQGRESSTATDIYALGLVLYELFTGQQAFEGRSPPELARHHLEKIPPPPSSLVASIDRRVEQAILTCLAKDPEDRPESALALTEAFAPLSGNGSASGLEPFFAGTPHVESPAAAIASTEIPSADIPSAEVAPIRAIGGNPRQSVAATEPALPPDSGGPQSPISASAAAPNGIQSAALGGSRPRLTKRRLALLIAFAAVIAAALWISLTPKSGRLPEYETVRELARLGVLAVPSENGYKIFLDESIDSTQLPEVWLLLRNLHSVEELAISDVKGFTALEPVRQFDGLTKLSLAELAEISELDALEGLLSIRELSLSELPGVSDLGPVGTLENLRKLQLEDLKGVDDLEAIQRLKALEELVISEMRKISPERLEALKVLLPHLDIQELETRSADLALSELEGTSDSSHLSFEPQNLEAQTLPSQMRAFEAPRLGSSVQLPDYPRAAKAVGIQGEVRLRVTINPSGLVDKIVVLESLPFGVTEVAVDAVTDWSFQPARLDGREVSVDYDLVIGFVGRQSGGFVVLFRSGKVSAIHRPD